MAPVAIVSFDSSAPGSSWSFHPTTGYANVVRCQQPHGGSLRETLGQMNALHDRWVGYFAYDCGRFFEDIPSIAEDDLGLPLFAFMQFGGAPQAPKRVIPTLGNSKERVTSTFSKFQYIAAVRRALDYIAAGDIFQVNLSQRFTAPLRDDPWNIYCRLHEQYPSLYGAYLDFGDFQLISNSPELFLRVTPLPDGRRRVITRPIKGTRPRLSGMEEQLRQSAKDQAELNMIIDLERNDLGRICEIGSVHVSEPRSIETHPTVYHGVATIEGILRTDVTLFDLLRATFPGGSVTGAPKIRAMQIIEELEPLRRGPYCGAIGYLADDGSLEFNLAIRTMIARDGRIHIPVGGGIVADSDPDAEYEETLVKAKAMLAALGI